MSGRGTGRVGRVCLNEDDVRMWAAQAREVFHAPVHVRSRSLKVEGTTAVVWVAIVFDGAHKATQPAPERAK